MKTQNTYYIIWHTQRGWTTWKLLNITDVYYIHFCCKTFGLNSPVFRPKLIKIIYTSLSYLSFSYNCIQCFSDFYISGLKMAELNRNISSQLSIWCKLDVHKSVHRDTIIKETNKMQLYRLIYFSLSALHVSDSSSVHHHEFSTIHTAMVYVSKPVWQIPLLCVQWKTPDDGQRNYPKHVEFHTKI